MDKYFISSLCFFLKLEDIKKQVFACVTVFSHLSAFKYVSMIS